MQIGNHSAEFWLQHLRECQRRICEAVLAALRRDTQQHLAEVAFETEGDVIFEIDRIAEQAFLSYFEQVLAREANFVLIAEGLPDGGKRVFPQAISEDEAEVQIILDPIDGTRPLMFDKRSAWSLAGVAPNRGEATHLGDIVLAVQTEIPVSKQGFADRLWAVRGEAARAVREDLATGRERPYEPLPSRKRDLLQGFGGFVRYFHGSKELISRIDEALAEALYGPVEPGRARIFEDQYMSTGGQIYELATGRDRFVADLRALVDAALQKESRAAGLCCHPYDLCTFLIAECAGAVITDERGRRPMAPMDVTTNINWIGYANASLKDHIEPHLMAILKRVGLL